MNKSTFVMSFFCFIFASANAIAESQKAHVHGLVTMTLALEKETLEIQIESPAESLLGFEHKARQSKEKQVVRKTEKLLNAPELLFSFKGASCKPKVSTVDLSRLITSKDNHDKDHENHSKGYDGSSHSEVSASYLFYCEQGENLDTVSVSLFELFPGIVKINAMWITESRQGAELLNSKRNIISLR